MALPRSPLDAAAFVRSTCGLGTVPESTDLRRILERFEATVEHDVDLVEDGRLDRSASGWIVRLGSAPSFGRERFTLAHEIGHLVLAHYGEERTDEERWCDRFAGATLLPGDWVRGHFASRRPGFDALRSVSAKADVTYNAAAIALNRHAGWRMVLVAFKQFDGRWRLAGTGMLPRELRYRIRTTDRTASVLAPPGWNERRVDLPLRVGSTDVLPTALVAGDGPTRWALFRETDLEALGTTS